MRLCRAKTMGWMAVKEKNIKRLQDAMIKFRQALERDEREPKQSGLPKDWRNRILRAVLTPSKEE